MDVYVWIFLFMDGWLRRGSLKQHRSVQKTFLCLFWHKHHTKNCDRKRGQRTLVSLKEKVSQLGVRPQSAQSRIEGQSVKG